MPAFHGGARHRYVIEYVSLLTTISHTAARILFDLQCNTSQCSAVQYVSMFTASRTCGGDYRHAAAKTTIQHCIYITRALCITAVHLCHAYKALHWKPPYSVAYTSKHCNTALHLCRTLQNIALETTALLCLALLFSSSHYLQVFSAFAVHQCSLV